MRSLLLTISLLLLSPLQADTLRQFAADIGLVQAYTKAATPQKQRQLFIDEIHRLISDGKIAEASDVAARLYELLPDDKEVIREYATLLFWQQKPDEADALFQSLISKDPKARELKAYQQNRRVLQVKKAEQFLDASPAKAIAYLQGLSAEERRDYDLHLLYIQALIRSGDLKGATVEAEHFYADYPESMEAKSILADLLFWQGAYDKSLQYYEEIYDSEPTSHLKERIAEVKAAKEEAISKLDKAEQIVFYRQRYAQEKRPQDGIRLAQLYLETGAIDPALELLEQMAVEHPRDIEIARLYMASLLNTYNKTEANHLLYTLDDEAVAELQKKYPYLYCRTLVNKLEVGGIFFDYSDDRYTDNTAYVQYETPIDEYILVGLLQEVWRYGLRDTDLQADLYRAFSDQWWGYATLSFSPEANFMPQFGGGAHLYKGLGSFELGFGYEYSHYKTTDVHMFIPEYSYYFLQGFTWTQKLYYVPASESYALVSQLGYESNCHYKVQAEYTWANSNERIENIDAFQNAKNNALRLSGEYRLKPEWALGGALSHGTFRTDVDEYTQSGLQLYVRRAW